ncbi:hypothetical protein IPM65_07245 [Candidatus Roizmanbacteria bacterium]|nr:MAG: hypothetical protein IPM65_07245 [Candidatus Roizmanbacteria bacterium]
MGLRLWDISKTFAENCKKNLQKGASFDLFRSPKATSKNIFTFFNSVTSYLSSLGIARKFQYVIALAIVVFVFGSAVYFVNQIYALTLYFTQSDWSGGADTDATINNSNATGWTKFYSKTAGIDNSTSGEIKIKIETSP